MRGEVIATAATEQSTRGVVVAMVAVLRGDRLSGLLSELPLGGVRQVAGRQRVSRFGCDVDRSGCFSQDREAGSLDGLGYEHRKPRESSRWQAGRGHRRGPTAEEAGAAGAQRPDAVPQVDQSPPQNGNCGTGKGGHQARGLQKEEIDLTQLLLATPPRRQREVETLQAKRLAEVDCSSPLSPQQWALGLARIKFEEWYTSVDFEAKASVDPYSEVPSQGSPATPQHADPVSTTPIVTTSAGSNFRAAKAPFHFAAGCAVDCGVSDKQESRAAPGTQQISNAADRPLREGEL